MGRRSRNEAVHGPGRRTAVRCRLAVYVFLLWLGTCPSASLALGFLCLGGTRPPVEREPVDSALPDAAPGTGPATRTADTESDTSRKTDLSNAGPHAEGEELVSPCRPSDRTSTEDSWVDGASEWLEHTVCTSADWLDRKFGSGGDAPLIDDYGTSGYVLLGASWNGHDGFDELTRMRVHVELPRFEGRLSAMFGREDRDTAVRGTRRFDDRTHLLEGNDAEWLVGLGYKPVRGDRLNLDLDGGIHLASPLNPYVRGRIRTFSPLSDRGLARLDQSLFWEAHDGLGATTQMSLEHLLRYDHLLRWYGRATLSESTEGVDWQSEIGWFTSGPEGAGMALQLEVNGETEADVSIDSYLVRFRYRRAFHREWLFYELRPALVWPRSEPEEVREMTVELGFRIEMAFGDRARRLEEGATRLGRARGRGSRVSG